MNLEAEMALRFLAGKPDEDLAAVLSEVLARLPASRLDLLAQAVITEIQARNAPKHLSVQH